LEKRNKRKKEIKKEKGKGEIEQLLLKEVL
jgi:hypothetical protein